MKTFLCLIFTIALFPLQAIADEIRTEFLALSIHEPVDGLYYWHDDEARPLAGSLAGLGQPYPYHGPSRLILHRDPHAFLEEPPVTPPAAVINLPDADRVLLLLFKRRDSPLKIEPIPVDTDGLRPGDYRVFNFSTIPLVIGLDEEFLTLEPGANGQLTHSNWRQETSDMSVRVGVSIGDRPRLVYSSVWGHYPGRRNFVFLFDGQQRSNPIVFRRMHDWPAPPPRPEAP
ncbi:MAG: hypothetical protein JJU05_09780 [Verrucomicrobia bacterium]|nr:hypothetical protein [Verrucomicrobiota bacterium]MCH8527562.1 hypothetical protein [Kiritimatiellia bacterium]